MIRQLSKSRIVKLLSSAVLIQATLSGANFLVGILLIRHTADEQYGFYALAFSALSLLTSLQNAYVYPSAVIRLTSANLEERAGVVGGLYRAQRQFMPIGSAAVIVISIVLWALGALQLNPLLVIVATSLASLATLHREFFRMVLMAHRRADEVLKGDMIYVVLLIAGAALAAWSTHVSSNIPAIVAVLSLGFAAWMGGLLQRHYMWHFEPWNRSASTRIVRDIVHIGGWGVGGAAIYWAATQGYSYIVAGSLGVAAVAALAGTRLIMMPVNLLSTGIVSIVAPTSSEWLRTRGPMICFKRLSLVALGMACIALCYIPFMWVLRNWIFGTVLHKVFPSRDNLILFWGAIFTVSCLRDQLGLYLMMRGRTRTLTLIAACSAAVSLSATLAAMQLFGLPGALAGLLLGEMTNASCTLWISWLDARKSQAEYASDAAATPGLSPG